MRKHPPKQSLGLALGAPAQLYAMVLSVTLVAAASIEWASAYQNGEMRLIDGIVGKPIWKGYAESLERLQFFVILGLAALAGAGLSEIFFRLRRKPAEYRTLCLVATFLLTFLGFSRFSSHWPQRVAWFSLIIFLPWKRMAAALRLWLKPFITATRLAAGKGMASAALAALSITVFLFQQFYPPDQIHESTSMARALLFVLSGMSLFLGFWQVFQRVSGSWSPRLDVLVALSPILPLVKLLLIHLKHATIRFHGLPAWVTWSVPAVFLVFVCGLAMGLGRRRSARGEGETDAPMIHWFATFSLPCIIYLTAHRFLIAWPLNLHESDILTASRELLHGALAYRDIFVPHGIGNALIGTLGMRLFGEEVGAFRILYTWVSPLTCILLYFIWRAVLGHRYVLLPALLSWLTYCAQANDGGGRDLGELTWFGGIKLIGPLMCLLIAIFYIRWSRSKRFHLARLGLWSGLLGAIAAVSLFINLEHGVAALGVSGVALLVAAARIGNGGRSIFIGVPCFLLSYAVTTALLWLPFTELGSLIEHLRYHLLEFPFLHSAHWGLPFFRNSFEFSAPTVLFSVNVAAIWYFYRFRNLTEKRLLLLLLPCVVSLVVYQIPIGRSDWFHWRVWCLVGVFQLLSLLLALLPVKVVGVVAGLVLVSGSFELEQSAGHLVRELLRKRQSMRDFHYSTSVNQQFSGRYPSISSEDEQILRLFQSVRESHPTLGDRALLLTEKWYLFRHFAGIREATNLPLFHYILGVDHQRRVVALLQNSDVRMVIYGPNPWDFVPAYARLPILSDYLHRNYSPCAKLASGLVILARKDVASSCIQSDEAVATILGGLPRITDLGLIPKYLGQSQEIDKYFGDILFAEVRLTNPHPVQRKITQLQLRWSCGAKPHGMREVAITFELASKVRRYLIPLSPNPAWAYCDMKHAPPVVESNRGYDLCSGTSRPVPEWHRSVEYVGFRYGRSSNAPVQVAGYRQ